MSELGYFMQLTFLNEQKHKLGNISTMQVIMVLDTLFVALLYLIQKEHKLVFIKVAKVLRFFRQTVN